MNNKPNIDLSISKKSLQSLAWIWNEMNAIKARDGSPHGVDPRWWEELMNDLDGIVELATGDISWQNRILNIRFK